MSGTYSKKGAHIGLTAVIILSIVLPFVVVAHGTGASHEEVVDGYVIDIGYDPAVVEAGTQARFDFNILNDATKEVVPFTDIWLRITKDNTTYFAGGVHKARIGLTGVSYIFPEEGEYEISVRYQNEGEAITEISFPLPVSKGTQGATGGSTDSKVKSAILAACSLVVGLIIGYLVHRPRNSQHTDAAAG